MPQQRQFHPSTVVVLGKEGPTENRGTSAMQNPALRFFFHGAIRKGETSLMFGGFAGTRDVWTSVSSHTAHQAYQIRPLLARLQQLNDLHHATRRRAEVQTSDLLAPWKSVPDCPRTEIDNGMPDFPVITLFSTCSRVSPMAQVPASSPLQSTPIQMAKPIDHWAELRFFCSTNLAGPESLLGKASCIVTFVVNGFATTRITSRLLPLREEPPKSRFHSALVVPKVSVEALEGVLTQLLRGGAAQQFTARTVLQS